MKLELKNIKHSSWASEETHCYQASLYMHGEPIAIVSNDGRGGCDRDYEHPKFKGDYRASMKIINNYLKSLLDEDGDPQQLEFWCCDRVNDWLSARELKSKLKKGFLYTFVKEEGVYGSKVRPSRAQTNISLVLNDIPFEDALALWKETA